MLAIGWFGSHFRDIIAFTGVAITAGIILALMVVQVLTWFKSWTACGVMSQRKNWPEGHDEWGRTTPVPLTFNGEPVAKGRPAPLPADYDFPPPISEMSFTAPTKERTDDDL